jgi:RNA-directed DNA polymerase
MKVRPIDANVSNTLIGKSKNTIIQPLTWPIPKRIGKYSVHAKPINENLANKQLKSHWINIDWKAVETHVNRLQVRITKAVFKGKWNLVKRLCYLLAHSFYAKLLAIRKVTQNKGKRTAGIDGECWKTPESKMKAALKLSGKRYKSKPLKRVYIEKYGKSKKRPLGIPTMYDRAVRQES